MLSAFDSPRSSSKPQFGIIPLRVGAGASLLYLHAWSQAVAAYHFLWSGTPWDAINHLKEVGLPFPTALAVTSALLTCLVAVCWLLGFLTRFFSGVFLPFALGALWVANRSSQFNNAEISVLYFLIALTLLISGPGWLSLDTLFRQRRSKSKSRYA